MMDSSTYTSHIDFDVASYIQT